MAEEAFLRVSVASLSQNDHEGWMTKQGVYTAKRSLITAKVVLSSLGREDGLY